MALRDVPFSVFAPAMGLAACTVAVLVEVGVPPLVAVVLMGAAALVPLMVVHPGLCLLAIVVVEVSNASGVADRRGIPGVSSALLLIGLLSVAVGIRRGDVRVPWSPLYLTGAVFLASRTATILVAEEPAFALAAVADEAQGLVFMFVVIALATGRRALFTALATAAATAAAVAAMSVVQEFVLGNSWDFFGFSTVEKPADPGSVAARHGGPGLDVNFWGRLLVLFLPLSLAYCGRRGVSGLVRLRGATVVWLGAVASVALGIYLTGSRGALIAAGLGTGCWLLLAGRRWRRLLLVITPVFLLSVPFLPGVGSRLATLGDVSLAAAEEGDPSLVGRVNAQEQGLAMISDHPATGVGAGNFEVAGAHYQRRLGRTSSLVIAPHNLYLQMAAEGGIGGLAAWLLFYATGVFVAARPLLRRPEGEHDIERLLSAGLVAGLLAWGLASVFLHLSNFRVLVLVLGLAVALDVRSTQRDPIPALDDAPRPPRRRLPARPLVGASTCFVAAVVLGSFALPLESQRWVSQIRAEVVPLEPGGPYRYDVARRRGVVKTMAAIVETDRVVREAADRLDLAGPDRETAVVQVYGSPVSGAVTVTATSPKRAVAASLAPAVLGRGIELIGSLDRLYGLRPIEHQPAARRATERDAGAVLRLVVAAAAGAALAGWFLTPRAHPRGRVRRGRAKVAGAPA